MTIKEECFILLIMGISACFTSNVCPPKEDIPDCSCKSDPYALELLCIETTKEIAIQNYRKILLDNKFEYKKNIKLTFSLFLWESRLPSRVFQGFDIKELIFFHTNISRWADEEGGQAFVGLEDTLEKLSFDNAIYAPRKYDPREVKAPMSLGHLRKLRQVHFVDNDIDIFANGWFDKGPTSLEELFLLDSKTRSIEDRAFASLTNLKHIFIEDNAIMELSRTMFPIPANHLEEIHLSDNKLFELPDDIFTDMPSLTEVHLENNHISRIAEVVWRPVWSKLKTIYLSTKRTKSDLICDEEINWIFNVRPPTTLYAICQEPEHMTGVNLEDLIKEKQKQD